VVRHDAQFPAPGRLDPARARALWFVCAEALANAAKHAPGAPVEITVRTSAYAVEVRVRDQGPGGADPSGSGLTGLSERAASVGGWLRMSSDRSGTELVIGVPLTGTPVPDKPFATTARTLMQVTAPTGTVAP
jgi:signal transduction histidine kinase